MGANGEYVAQYDEIPYGDVGGPAADAAAAAAAAAGHSGKGKLPQVPSEYSQVPQIPARQGKSGVEAIKITTVAFGCPLLFFPTVTLWPSTSATLSPF